MSNLLAKAARAVARAHASAFPDVLQAEERGDRTVLTIMADQAALYGVLAEAEALGLELLEVRPLPARGPQTPSL